jgi:hypothetical protein
VGRGKKFGYVIATNFAMIENMSSDSDEERLARLERKGAIRRGAGDLAAWFKTHKPIEIPECASVLQALLEERESGR